MAILHVNPLDNFPNCPNFKVWEAFTTSAKGWAVRSPVPELKNTPFSPKLFQEFTALPEQEKQVVWANMCQAAILLQFARDTLGFPIPIASWYRSLALDKAIGRKTKRHITGGAVDPKLSATRLKQFLDLFDKFGGGLGRGASQGHLDVLRLYGNKDRWTY